MNGWHALAERQYGVISRSQLRAAGLTDRKIDVALGANRIERLYAGVFRVQGSYRSARQRAMAAVIWCGESALLSHETSGSLLRLPVSSELIHVSVPGARRRDAPDVVVHRTDTLEARDRVVVDGLPCTSGTRTVIDLAAVLQGEDLEHVVETARRFGLTTRRLLGQRSEELCGRGRAGSSALKALLKAVDDRPKESKLEVKTARLLAIHGLRPEASQYRVGTYRLDHAWPSLMFGVESDGFQWHGTRLAWKRDRRRIAELETRGWSLVHLTWDDVATRPLETIERVRHGLQRARGVARGALPAQGLRIGGTPPWGVRGMRSLLGIRRGALGVIATTIAVGGLSLATMPAAHAAALTPTCDAFGIDAQGNPTQPPLAEGNTLPPLDLPSLGAGVTHIPTGLTFPVSTPSGSPVSLPDEATVKIAGNPVTLGVAEIKNITLHFKIDGAAAVSPVTLSGGNVLGASAVTTKTSLTLTLPGKQNGSTMPKGNAFFPGGSSFTPPSLALTVTAPKTPGTISTSLTGMNLMVQVTLGATKINTALDCTFPTNTLGSVSVVQPGAPVAVDDQAETSPAKAVTIDVLAKRRAERRRHAARPVDACDHREPEARCRRGNRRS